MVWLDLRIETGCKTRRNFKIYFGITGCLVWKFVVLLLAAACSVGSSFCRCRSSMPPKHGSGQENPVDPKINEHYLWHGCKPEACLCKSSCSLGDEVSGICKLVSVRPKDMKTCQLRSYCDCSCSTFQRAAVLVPRKGQKAARLTTASTAAPRSFLVLVLVHNHTRELELPEPF